jgi:uncharacterized YceG family protein
VRKIAKAKRNVTPALSGNAYAAATKAAKVPPAFRQQAKGIEGFLFPATYDFLRKTPSRKLVRGQLEFFCDNWRKLDLRYARSKNLTPYDVLIIASMIEKEAAVPAERKLVAAVIYNRLHLGMSLGIDATLRYGLGIQGTRAITAKQQRSDSPYNTNRFKGLPPTPIGNPGLASMRAAASPAAVDYLYYVRKPDSKRHYFTADEADFCRTAVEYGYKGC